MNRRTLALLPIAFSVLAWLAGYFFQTIETHSWKSFPHGNLLWLKKEFSLNEDSFQKILKLHEDYRPLCNSLRERAAHAGEALKKVVRENRELSVPVKKALQEDSILRELSQNTLLDFAYSVASAMPAKEGEKYVEMLFPTISKMGNPH